MKIVYKVLEKLRVVNKQKNSSIKDKIKSNIHFDNTFTEKDAKDNALYNWLKLRKVDIKTTKGIKIMQHF